MPQNEPTEDIFTIVIADSKLTPIVSFEQTAQNYKEVLDSLHYQQYKEHPADEPHHILIYKLGVRSEPLADVIV